MKKWKKPLLAMVLLLTLMVIGGMYSSGTFQSYGGRNKRIIYIYKTTLNEIEFWRSVTAGIKIGAKEYGYEYSILGPRDESDVEGNILALQRAISLKPDVIVLSAADYELLAPYAEKAVEAGILLLTLDSDVAGEYSRCYVGTDNYGVGWKMGEELMARIPPGSRIGIISHVATSYTASERVRGATDAVEKAGGVVLAPAYCDNVANKAKEDTLVMLKEYPDIAGFVATNELAAMGMCEALIEAGVQDKVVAITCDHSSGQISYLEQGVIDATIVQKPFNMGYFSVQLSDKLLHNYDDPTVPKVFDTGWEVITLDNYFTSANQQLLFPLP